MVCLQPLGLPQELLRRGDDDDHVDRRVGVVVLVGDVVNVLRHGNTGRCQVGPCLRGVVAERQIVEAQVGATGLADGDGIVGRQRVFNGKSLRGDGRLAVAVGRRVDDNRSYLLAVHQHAGGEGTVVGEHHRELALRTFGGGKLVRALHAGAEEAAVVQVAPAVIPGVVVDLAERVVVVGGGVVVGLELLLADGQRRRVVLSQEVVAVVAVGVAGTGGGGVAAPAHGPDSIEEPPSADGARRHLFQVVGLADVVGSQPLGLQGSAVAVDFHLINIRKPRATHQIAGKLVDARLRHADFSPAPGSKYRKTHPRPLPVGRGVISCAPGSRRRSIYSPPYREGSGVGLYHKTY